MKDTIIKGSGNSRTLASVPNFLTLYPTYEAFAQALINRELPIDLGPLNSAGCAQIGNDLNKETLLQDFTCYILNIPTISSPNEALLKLALGTNKYGYNIHVQLWDGTPATNVPISGVTSLTGGNVTTDTNGNAVGVSTSQSITITATSPWIDVNSASQSVRSNGILTNVSIILQAKSGYSTITSSGTYKLSPKVKTYDLTGVGGGGNGSSGSSTYSVGGGGGGGYVSNAINLKASDGNTLVVTIGAAAGTTTVTRNGSNILTAKGGQNAVAYASAAIGNGNGGSASTAGGNASGYLFNDSSLGIAGGGGGGAGITLNNPTGVINSGAPNGATGGYGTDDRAIPATRSKSPGGGGGGGNRYGATASIGSAGALFLRVHY